ncbi:hypothetical protein DAB59_16290 [Salmonella enterica]|nr:hypothetical protein [Salmonella enterica]
MKINLIRKCIFLATYTVLVAGLAAIGTSLYFLSTTPDPSNYMKNERNWVGQCEKTGNFGDRYQLTCSDLDIFVKAEDYDRALRAWERTGNLKR